MNRQIKGTDVIGYVDNINIVFSDKHIIFIPEGESALNTTFDEIMDVALTEGYKEEQGAILVVAQNPLVGKVYRYGEYGAFWVEDGEFKGYA